VLRELEANAARAVAEAFLTASCPLEVYRVALAHVAPLLGASFASVYIRDPEDPELVRPACAHEWPQASARYLGAIRVRSGQGPTGRAALQGEVVAVEDVFRDPSLRNWWEAAREIGFTAVIAQPLKVARDIVGVVTFYFRDRRGFGEAERALLGVVAHQLAAAAGLAGGGDDLRARTLRLEREHEALRRSINPEAEAGPAVHQDGNEPGRGSR
jgi:GAF domain-containing protein